MSFGKALISALHFLIVFIFFTGGVFFACLPYLPRTLENLISMLSYHPEMCTKIGIILLSLSLLLFLIFYAFEKGKYLVIRMGVKVNLKMVRQAVEDCFEKQFPKKISLKEIEIGPKAHLEFLVAFKPIDEGLREELYVQVENQLSILLKERFGYSKSFNLILSAI